MREIKRKGRRKRRAGVGFGGWKTKQALVWKEEKKGKCKPYDSVFFITLLCSSLVSWHCLDWVWAQGYTLDLLVYIWEDCRLLVVVSYSAIPFVFAKRWFHSVLPLLLSARRSCFVPIRSGLPHSISLLTDNPCSGASTDVLCFLLCHALFLKTFLCYGFPLFSVFLFIIQMHEPQGRRSWALLSLGSLPFGSIVGSKYTLEVNSEERRQVEALTQLSGMLSIDAEESLSASSLDSFVLVLVGLPNHESNLDIMLLRPGHWSINVMYCFLHV